MCFEGREKWSRLSSCQRLIRRAQGFKLVGMVALAVAAVVCLASVSEHMGVVQRSELLDSQLHNGDSAQDFDVADAILSSAGVHDKHGSISASMAALAAQVLVACSVLLPVISST